ncbi:MAG: DUF1838 family protein [Woeseiaceae bacterium]|nr:DUF1838 family protein [Woeseiaceae bacterium]
MAGKIDRRTLLSGMGAATATGALGVGLNPSTAKAASRTTIDFSSDAENVKAYAKLGGTIEDGSVYYWYSGTIYGVTKEATKPLVGWTGLLKMVWKNLGNGSFHYRNFDLAYFTEPGSSKRIEEFENSFTGEKNHPIDVKGGPFDVVIEPKQYKWDRFGDDIFMVEPKHFRFQNKLDPDEWPLASTGKTLNMLYIDGFSGKLSDLENDDLVSAPALLSVHHVNPWYPFFLVGKSEGVNYWHGQGKKVFDLSEVTPELLKYCEDTVPGFFESDTPWPARQDSYTDYKLHRKPIDK